VSCHSEQPKHAITRGHIWLFDHAFLRTNAVRALFCHS